MFQRSATLPPMFYAKAAYLLSAHKLADLPPDRGLEVAFAGRSNAGKSSAINAITGIRGLARTSKTPGRTQQIIYFRLDQQRCLVDLPGYGYAKVPAHIKAHWEHTLAAYLETRRALRGLVLVMDVRHPLKPPDEQMLGWCARADMPVHVLLTKSDKLGSGAGAAALQRVRAALRERGAAGSAQLFSALRGQGLEEARARLDGWLELRQKKSPGLD